MTSDKLYELAFRYKKMKLWKVLDEGQLFAIKLSDGRIGYVSVMGAAGEHCALALYPGEEGFSSFRSLSMEDPSAKTSRELREHVLQQTCLQCSFEGKDQISEEEREEVKQYARGHGIRISGKNAYPHFFKCRPNRLPWHLQNGQDVDNLCTALAAALEIALRLAEQTPQELGMGSVYDDVKEVPLMEYNGSSWEWSRTELPQEKPREFPAPDVINQIALASLKKAKRSGIWECGIIQFPQPVQNGAEEAPFFPSILLVVESSSGYILHVDTVEDYDENPEGLVNAFVEALLRENIRPIKLKVRDQRTYSFAKALCDKLKIGISIEEDMPALDEAEDDFMERFGPEDGTVGDGLDELMEIIDQLMQLDERELHKLPPELGALLGMLSMQGILPEELQEKLDRVLLRKEDSGARRAVNPKKRKKSRSPAFSYIISVSLGTGCYRHLQISSSCTLYELHSAILGAFDFYDGHAHAFFMDNVSWSQRNCYYVRGMEEEDRDTSMYTLEEAGLRKGMKFKYVYDFGDEWTFQCRVLRTIEQDTSLPCVIKGVGRAPDQDGRWDWDE